MSWWHREIVAAGKLPLMLCFLAFVVTFVLTRTITRSIRDDRGPFDDQVTKGGLHIHHAIPGLVLLIVGAFTGVGAPNSLAWRCAAAVLIGIGTSLVLDEFALMLDLKDVYWSGEGQLSVQAVTLTAAVLGLMLAGFTPVDIPGLQDVERLLRIGATGLLLVDGLLALVGAVKGKYRCALFGIFLPGVAGGGRCWLNGTTSSAVGPQPPPSRPAKPVSPS